MAHTHLNQERTLKAPGLTFWMVFALGFSIVFTIALVGSLTGMPWRSWLPGAESKSLLSGVQAAVYSFMSHTL
jgi:light-harvesting complex 1 beta chain